MATERLSMRNTREILRQKWSLSRSNRETARSVAVSASVVQATVDRAREAELDWASVQTLPDDELERRIYPSAVTQAARVMPDFAQVHAERLRPGVTLELLHVEYKEQHPDGYGYTRFCELYRTWARKRSLSMRQEHRAGDKVFVDYSGKRPHLVDPKTGEPIDVELFVAVLGASNYTYAEATLSQRGPDFIASHLRAFAFLGGVPAAVIPDQLKSGVTVPCRYEPGVQRTYEEMAAHYGTTVLPARPKHPRDKAKVEVGVQIAQRWILARLRNQTFFTLGALNERIAELLDDLNSRTMRVYGASRQQLFERIDRPALKPLPTERFVYGDWLKARVNIDYHVEVDHHYYSAPHPLVHEQLDVRLTGTTVELFHRSQRLVTHARSFERGRHTTVPEHMPKAHQKQAGWTPSRILAWAATIGPKTTELATAILDERRHPEQGYRSCLGILRLGKRYGDVRLEAACARALTARARSYRHVESILKHGLDRIPVEAGTDDQPKAPPLAHENVRGRTYYH
jgi:transposase